MGQGFYGFPNILDIVRATTFKAIGKAGATGGAALAGGTASGAPVAPAGPFDQGDVIVDATGSLWICTLAGTSQSSPGTFVQVGPSPLTTKGDLYAYGTANARVPIGGDGTVLTADSTQALGLKWGTPGTGSGAGNMSYQGAWAVGTTYNVNDVVTSGGHLWIAASGSTGTKPIAIPSSGYLSLLQQATPTTVNSNVGANYNYANDFFADDAGTVSGVRFYKGASDTGTHIGYLWDTTGPTLVTSVTFTGETASGWQYMAFSSPQTLVASRHYRIALHMASNIISFGFTVVADDTLHSGNSVSYGTTAAAGTYPNTAQGATWAVDLEYLPPGYVAGGTSPWTKLA